MLASHTLPLCFFDAGHWAKVHTLCEKSFHSQTRSRKTGRHRHIAELVTVLPPKYNCGSIRLEGGIKPFECRFATTH